MKIIYIAWSSTVWWLFRRLKMGVNLKPNWATQMLHVQKIKTIADKMAQWIKSLVVNV